MTRQSLNLNFCHFESATGLRAVCLLTEGQTCSIGAKEAHLLSSFPVERKLVQFQVFKKFLPGRLVEKESSLFSEKETKVCHQLSVVSEAISHDLSGIKLFIFRPFVCIAVVVVIVIVGVTGLHTSKAQFTQDALADLHANLGANPLMLLATCVNTPQ